MNNEKHVNIPFPSHFKLYSILCPSSEEKKDYMSHLQYANAVGFLMYVMVCTRLNISHADDVASFHGKYEKNYLEIVK